MGFDVRLSSDAIELRLSGWDALANLRRRLDLNFSRIDVVRVASRDELERTVDHRVLGIGTHDGHRRPNRRRVGTMLGRGTRGRQFWAAPAGSDSDRLVVVDVTGTDRFDRVIVADGDPERLASEITERLPVS